MKCPVCDKENETMLCTRCGFDGSRDYGRYPSLAPAEAVPSPSALRRKWNRKQELSGVLHVFEVDSSVFGSAYQRNQIKSVTFVDTLAEMPGDAWDVSEAGDGSVMAWVKPNGELYDLFIGGEGAVRTGVFCGFMFYEYYRVERITFGGVMDTSSAQDMAGMFYNCSSLTTLDLNGLNTSTVQNMAVMFYGCRSLTTLDLSGFDTSKVWNMSKMFYGCSSLTVMNFGYLDPSEVKDKSETEIGYMVVRVIREKRFDTSYVKDMDGMFAGCSSLVGLNLIEFDTSYVRNMREMFSGCSSLTALDLSRFDTTYVKNMIGMFSGCSALTQLELPEHFIPADADTQNMFSDCPAGSKWKRPSGLKRFLK